MKKTIVVYGSTTGTCEGIAQMLASKLDTNAIEVTQMTQEIIEENEALILGTSTWGAGDLQDDWYDGVNVLKEGNLEGKTIALFGCGDAGMFSDTFCDGIGTIYHELQGKGCSFIGEVDTEGYSYSGSTAEINGMFVGLPLDDANEGDKTEERIDAWVSSLKSQL